MPSSPAVYVLSSLSNCSASIDNSIKITAVIPSIKQLQPTAPLKNLHQRSSASVASSFSMDRKIADELYPEIMSNLELDPKPVTDCENHNSRVSDSGVDDLWYDDGDLYDKTEKPEKASDMDREWQRRHEQFHTIGYRDGLMAGKEASAQEGFNIGFRESVFVGQRWGVVRGVTSALACLPDALKERLVENEDKRNKLQYLHEAVHAISTTDALKRFHDCLNTKLTEQGKIAERGPHAGDLCGQCSDENFLEYYIGEFNSLILECSAIEVHLE